MPIKLNTASGGGVILTGANTASDKTITVPAADGTMIYSDSSGNVGIGTSSPDGNLQVYKNAASSLIRVTSSTTGVAGVDFGDTDATDRGQVRYFNSGDYLLFATAATERARIDSSGNLIMAGRPSGAGNTGQLRVGQTASVPNSYAVFTSDSASPYPLAAKGVSTNQGLVGFFDSADSVIGSISKSGSTVAYNTSSDYRLKENVQPMTGALAKVAALKPCTYTWKADGKIGEGFIAHELAEVCPSAVTGEKDAVNEDGSINPQGIDTSFLVATLTAALQEQQQMIETLQAKVAALEAK